VVGWRRGHRRLADVVLRSGGHPRRPHVVPATARGQSISTVTCRREPRVLQRRPDACQSRGSRRFPADDGCDASRQSTRFRFLKRAKRTRICRGHRSSCGPAHKPLFGGMGFRSRAADPWSHGYQTPLYLNPRTRYRRPLRCEAQQTPPPRTVPSPNRRRRHGRPGRLPRLNHRVVDHRVVDRFGQQRHDRDGREPVRVRRLLEGRPR